MLSGHSMRRLAILGPERGGPLRLLLSESASGTLLFTRASAEDGPCEGEAWFEDTPGAEAYALEEHAIAQGDWLAIPAALPGCQEDWEAQVRVKGRDSGSPEWGSFQRWEEGAWRDIERNGTT